MKTRNVLIALLAVGMFSVPTLGQIDNNGSCVLVAKDVDFQAELWDLWSCAPNDPVLDFNRIDIAVGTDDQLFELSQARFVCLATNEKVPGVFKDHKKLGGVCADGSACDVALQNCADGSVCVEVNHEVWSGDFIGNCKGKVDAYLQAAVPTDPNPFIKEVSFTHTGPAKVPTVDGSTKGDPYGAAVSVQQVQTDFGDNQSELDAAYCTLKAGRLYLALTGNIEDNFNKLEIIIDSRPAGENAYSGVPGNDGTDVMGPAGGGSLVFDAGFEADYHVIVRRGFDGAIDRFDLDIAQLGSPNFSFHGDIFGGLKEGCGTTGVGPANGNPIEVCYDNSNLAGVIGGCDPAVKADALAVQTGVELSIALKDLGYKGGDIKVLAFVNGGGHDFASNQFLGPLTPSQCNLGGDGAGNFIGGPITFDLNDFAGTQYFTCPAAACESDAKCPGKCTFCDPATGTCQHIPNCCDKDDQCPDKCMVCNLATNACVKMPGCCTGNAQCPGKCMVCNLAANACVKTPGCCTGNAQCPGKCMVCNLATNACVKLPGCCTVDAQCPGKCQVCDLATNACVKRPGCCTADAQCGKCETCNLVTNTCVKTVPNCCDGNAQCGKCETCNLANNTCVKSVPNCCTSDAQCPNKCEVCDLLSNSCVLAQEGCCVDNLDCGKCETCEPTPDPNVNKCVKSAPNCCTSDAQCPDKCEFCNLGTNTCAPIAGCCETDGDCPAKCELCDFATNTCFKVPPEICCDSDDQCVKCDEACDLATNTCIKVSPPEFCCVADADCIPLFGEKCAFCDLATNECEKAAGCCDSDDQCGKCELCDFEANTCFKVGPPCCASDDQCVKCDEACDLATNTCVKVSPPEFCCVSDADCIPVFGEKCAFCDLATNECQKAVGCCDSDDQCGKCELCDFETNTCFKVGPPCCASDAQCPDKCEVCNLAANACVKLPGCCTGDAQCPGKCMICDLGANECVKLPGCCTTDDQCIKCDEACHLGTNTCIKVSPPKFCCVTDADCIPLFGAKCAFCVLASNTCQKRAGCCSDDSQCPLGEMCDLATNTCLPACPPPVVTADIASRYIQIEPDATVTDPVAFHIECGTDGGSPNEGWVQLILKDYDDGGGVLVNIGKTTADCVDADFLTPDQWTSSGANALYVTGLAVCPSVATLAEGGSISRPTVTARCVDCAAPDADPVQPTDPTWVFCDSSGDGQTTFFSDLFKQFQNTAAAGGPAFTGPDAGIEVDTQGNWKDVPDQQVTFFSDIFQCFGATAAGGGETWTGPTCP